MYKAETFLKARRILEREGIASAAQRAAFADFVPFGGSSLGLFAVPGMW